MLEDRGVRLRIELEFTDVEGGSGGTLYPGG